MATESFLEPLKQLDEEEEEDSPHRLHRGRPEEHSSKMSELVEIDMEVDMEVDMEMKG